MWKLILEYIHEGWWDWSPRISRLLNRISSFKKKREYIHEEKDARKLFGNITLLNIDYYFQMEYMIRSSGNLFIFQILDMSHSYFLIP